MISPVNNYVQNIKINNGDLPTGRAHTHAYKLHIYL